MKTLTALRIRRAAPDDLLTCRDLLRQLGYPDLDPGALGRTYRHVLGHAEMRILLAEDPQRGVVGLLTLSWRPQLRLAGLIATIDELVVAETVRGRGVGAALLAAARQEAERLGVGRLELLTTRSRESYRRAFYVKQGFFETDHAVLRASADQAR